ncbi:MAG TPA: outer membrane beta-barrel protein, partial [Terriglobales bacterium]|nr:outer membrane beta-barrel protein [Terriglobales bacterium]
MRRSVTTLLAIALLAASAAMVRADDDRDGAGAFVGANIGVAEPINGNYRAHVHTGGIISPYVGYMFHPNIGIQGELHFAGHPADIDDRGFTDEDDPTLVLGGTVGPRLSLPTWSIPSISFLRGMELYTTVQGGAVTGLDGRISHTGAMLSIGGGLDFYLTDHFAISAFARWMRMFTHPRPTILPNSGGVVQSPGEQGPKDAEFAAIGIGIKYDFRNPPSAPPACPACVCPECPGARKILLRNVHFDFDKTALRP